MKQPSDIRALERKIGYKFNDWQLLEKAITHSSKLMVAGEDNQRLEFLGDRVLALVLSERIMRDSPNAPPGELAVRLNALVSRPTCARIADSIQLGSVVRVGKSARKPLDRTGSTISGDAMEAIIGAIYLDGSLDSARKAIEMLWSGLIDNNLVVDQDPKSRLQIWAQARQKSPPDYLLLKRKGPDHNPLFTVEVRLESGHATSATGSSKQRAEINAARQMLQRIENGEI